MGDATVRENRYAGPWDTFGYLKTSGAEIVDASTGDTVRLVGANWHGAESGARVPGGLWARNYRDMMDEMAEAGLNTLRVPISPAILDDRPIGRSVRFDINPDLRGLNGLETLDKIVDYAEDIGLRIIIDMHRITPGVGKQESGLWFNNNYSEADLARDWQTIAAHYADTPTVIGFDLFNEPSGRGSNPHRIAHWGDGPRATDWHRVAERLGDAVLDVNPDALIFVEGVHVHDKKWYWVGGNLRGADTRPVELSVDDRLVYSPHDYPYSVQNVPWLKNATPQQMHENFREHWGYLYDQGDAPVVIGETGGRLMRSSDYTYFDALTAYMENTRADPDGGIGMLWWTWGVNSGDTGGLLSDWYTIDSEKFAIIDGLRGEMLPTHQRAADWLNATPMTFTFTQPNNLNEERTYSYDLRSGTATADVDFVDEGGFLRFAKGQREVEFDVLVLSDNNPREGTETFFVDIHYLDGRRFKTLTGEILEGGVRASEPARAAKIANDDTPQMTFLYGARMTTSFEQSAWNIVRLDMRLDSRNPDNLDNWSLRVEGLRELGLDFRFSDDVTSLQRKNGAVRLDGVDGSNTFSLDILTSGPKDDFSIRWSEINGNTSRGESALFGPDRQSGALDVDLQLVNIWQSGDFLARVDVTNTSSDRITDWALMIEAENFQFLDGRLHGADLSEQTAVDMTINPKGWNRALDPGETYQFSFNGAAEDASQSRPDAAELFDALDFLLV